MDPTHFEQIWATMKPEHFLNADLAWQKLSVRQRVERVRVIDPEATPKPEGCVRVVCISDTHGIGHDQLLETIPDGDILIHAGDFSNVGQQSEVEKFNTFLGGLPHKHKVVIAGNHDITFDVKEYEHLKMRFHRPPYFDPEEVRGLLTNCTYLEDSEVTVEGLRIYGSPHQPEFFGWGFNVPRGEPLQKIWEKIPAGIDILVTHGPPIGHGDIAKPSTRTGCVNLLKEIQTRIKPKYHIFGHIHEGYGVTTDGQTTYVNASTCNYNYKPVNPAIVFDVPVPAQASPVEAQAEEQGKGAK